jgi:hypothetical protein
MSANSVASTATLVAIQLVAIKAMQHRAPHLYFTTSALFSSRADVRGSAVLARLLVPFLAGALAYALSGDCAAGVAAVAGGVAWFLVIWPVVWNPRLLEQGWSWTLALVVALFQMAFVVLAVAGAGITEAIARGVDGDTSELQSQYAWALLTSLPLSALAAGASWFAGRRISFADDPYPEAEITPDDDLDEVSVWREWASEAPLYATPAYTLGLAVGALVGFGAWLGLKRGRR